MGFKADKKVTYDLANFHVEVIPSNVDNKKGKVDMPVKKVTTFLIPNTSGSMTDSDLTRQLNNQVKPMGFVAGASATLTVKVSAMYSNKEKRAIDTVTYQLEKGVLKLRK